MWFTLSPFPLRNNGCLSQSGSEDDLQQNPQSTYNGHEE